MTFRSGSFRLRRQDDTTEGRVTSPQYSRVCRARRWTSRRFCRSASAAGLLAGPLHKCQTRRSKIEMQAFLLYSLMGLCRAEEVSATVRPFAFGRSPLAWVGLYFMGRPVHSVPAQPHKTEPKVSAPRGHYP